MSRWVRAWGFLLICGFAIDALAQEPIGRWVKVGTFALSGFAPNAEREHTYRGAAKERSRLLSFMPPMTIVFPDFLGLLTNANIPNGYVAGITQTGTPIIVLDQELSKTKFGTYDTHDVVIHTDHDACKELYCDLDADGRTVRGGQSYKLMDDSIGGNIHLFNAQSEADFYYREERFKQLERRGTLTQMKGRIIPRWEIYEGYAKELSVGCGGSHPSGAKFQADSVSYESSPATWALNAPQWSVKAADLFVGSEVEKVGDAYVAELTKGVHDVTAGDTPKDGYQSAIDFTVFAYRDRATSPSNFEYAVLISIVACVEQPFSDFVPSYVREAHLYFDDERFKLPQQLSEDSKLALSNRLERSFLYSVNSPRQYERLFGMLAEGLDAESSDARSNLVAVVIARLNATCDGQRRAACARIVDASAK
ncbi:hypothetical protein FHT82_000068 [Rhizobium sp. BK275]|uniref:hypothetical protein n=1 Tax=unclassified Rhizobium TaxID=2613769 RepID=UPI001615E36C|nr:MULTISPECIES: hypothetical protein [unclassified Rhizobium]MBB3387348.1 hypothetical protein [Rhizobium sp. BK275]MBB3406704.1 hypothetical protein [Rhizobium sp. BK316]